MRINLSTLAGGYYRHTWSREADKPERIIISRHDAGLEFFLNLGVGQPMRISIRFPAFASILIFGLSASLFAQNASVSGSVADTQQAAIKGATVLLTRTSTGVQVQATTDQRGNFILPPVVPGTYEIEARAPGFSSTVLEGITLEVGESKSIALPLRVGSVQQSIQVSGTPPELNETTADRGLMIEPAFVDSIPLNIRNPLQLIDFAAGVTKGDDGLSGQDATSESRTNTFRINGAKGSPPPMCRSTARPTPRPTTTRTQAFPASSRCRSSASILTLMLRSSAAPAAE